MLFATGLRLQGRKVHENLSIVTTTILHTHTLSLSLSFYTYHQDSLPSLVL